MKLQDIPHGNSNISHRGAPPQKNQQLIDAGDSFQLEIPQFWGSGSLETIGDSGSRFQAPNFFNKLHPSVVHFMAPPQKKTLHLPEIESGLMI